MVEGNPTSRLIGRDGQGPVRGRMRSISPGGFDEALGVEHRPSLAARNHGSLPDALPFFPWASTLRRQSASGLGRSWKWKAIGTVPLPPSLSHGVRSPLVVHTPRPFHPALASSMRPSKPFA